MAHTGNNKAHEGRWYTDPMTGVKMYSSFKTKKKEKQYYSKLATRTADPQVATAAASHVAELSGRYKQPKVNKRGKVTGVRVVPEAVMQEEVQEVMDPEARQQLMVYLLQLRQRMAARVGQIGGVQ